MSCIVDIRDKPLWELEVGEINNWILKISKISQVCDFLSDLAVSQLSATLDLSCEHLGCIIWASKKFRYRGNIEDTGMQTCPYFKSLNKHIKYSWCLIKYLGIKKWADKGHQSEYPDFHWKNLGRQEKFNFYAFSMIRCWRSSPISHCTSNDSQLEKMIQLDILNLRSKENPPPFDN